MKARSIRISVRFLGLLGVLALLAASTSAIAANRMCATATVSEPFMLPDQSVHPAGAIRLCRVSDFTPSASFLVSYVDGKQVSMHIGKRGLGEADAGRHPFLVFHRDSSSLLHLYGYGIPGRNGVETFILGSPGRKGTTAARAEIEDEGVLIAAVWGATGS